MTFQNRRKEIIPAPYKPIMFLFDKTEHSSILNRKYLIPCSQSRQSLKWAKGLSNRQTQVLIRSGHIVFKYVKE
jgi:hypothetical protein